MVSLFPSRRGSSERLPSTDAVLGMARTHLAYQRALLEGGGDDDRPGLEKIHKYLIGKQAHPSVPHDAGPEIRRIAEHSKVNIMELIVGATAQAMYLEGYRAPVTPDPAQPEPEEGEPPAEPSPLDAPAWEVWQQNRMDKRQAGVHRSALAYGWSYVTVLPGDPVPVIRPWSPRRMIALYGDDDIWAQSAMALEPSGDHWALRLWDDEREYALRTKNLDGDELQMIEWSAHEAPLVPVVRFLNVEDPDEDFLGEIERLIPLQDQINDTTFELRVAQKYAAFRQRYVLGWTAASETDKVKANASRMWAFDDPDVKVGEFQQTELHGYLESREASLRHAAALSQTPAHELIGQLVNLSAEALVAAESSFRRKRDERKMSFGESWEQALALGALEGGFETVPGAQVRWADTDARAFGAIVDGLVKLNGIGVPIELLLERIPGMSQQDVKRALEIIASRPPAPAPPPAPTSPPEPGAFAAGAQ